jgi:hypothetical protein
MAAAERDPGHDSGRLRALHEHYVWQVNAAVAEGRDDLVAELADEYLEDALAELTAGATPPGTPPGTGPECAPEPATSGRTEELAVGPATTPRAWWRRVRLR